nr:toprim domain-containing protein [Candidatus Baldrarchaeota archaeon]
MGEEKTSSFATSQPIDVRIVVEGASDVEALSKAVQKLALGSQYNITISAIIPTTNPELALKAVEGADLALIATDADKPGRQLAEKLIEVLKGKVGHVERMKLPYGHDLEHVNIELIVRELENAIIRAGLKVIQQIKMLQELKHELAERKEEIKKLKQEIEKLKEKTEEKGLKPFRISELWKIHFPTEELPKNIEDAVNELKLAPDILAAQNYILAKSRDLAVQALRLAHAAIKLAKKLKTSEKAETTEHPTIDEFT